MAVGPAEDFEEEDLSAVRERVIVTDVVIGIAQKVVFDGEIAGVEHVDRSWSDEDQEEADGSLALAEDQDLIDTHPEAGEIANILAQNKKVQQLGTWAVREQIVGYRVFVEASVLRTGLDLDAMGQDSGGVGRAARTFDVLGHCHCVVERPVDVGKGGVGESVQIDSGAGTVMSWARGY